MKKLILFISMVFLYSGLNVAAADIKFTFEWDANPKSDNVTLYTLHFTLTSGGPYTKAAEVTLTRAEHIVPEDGRVRFYVVSATNTSGESGKSGEVQAKAQLAPGVPGNLRLLKVDRVP